MHSSQRDVQLLRVPTKGPLSQPRKCCVDSPGFLCTLLALSPVGIGGDRFWDKGPLILDSFA